MASKSRISYHGRLFIMLLLFFWAMVACFLVFQYIREKQFKTEFINAQLQTYNIFLLEHLEQGDSHAEFSATHRPPFKDLRITIISLQGEVIYDNSLNAICMGNHHNRPEILTAIKEGAGYQIGRNSESDGKRYFYSATRGEKRIVRSAIPYSDSLNELLQADWAFMRVMIIVTFFTSVVAYFATRGIGQTIIRLNHFAEKAEQGEEICDEEFPHNELGEISQHIVSLYNRLRQTIADRDREHLTALQQEQDKIRLKRQLTNNINHELKTPIASIQVCLETLLSNVKLSNEKRTELLDRCYSNCQRLRNLLSDVSLITRLDEGKQQIQKEIVCINDVLEELSDEIAFHPNTERLNINIKIDKKVEILGNTSLISSIFRNLMENAFAYSGGKNIYISLLGNTETEYILRFEDDGMGVANEHLDHLFERFYRVDKGRSRKAGGTGLGLAIVKHAVLFHNGKISATNRPNGGLRFDFSLAKR